MTTAEAAHNLHREIEAARILLATYEAILGDDVQARADAVEGETNLHEAIEISVARVIELDARELGLRAVIADMLVRADRFKEQRANLRAALSIAMELAGQKRFETPLATVTLKATPAKVIVTDEALIPSQYWKARDPALDKKALLDALKSDEVVPGATLSNGSATVQFTTR